MKFKEALNDKIEIGRLQTSQRKHGNIIDGDISQNFQFTYDYMWKTLTDDQKEKYNDFLVNKKIRFPFTLKAIFSNSQKPKKTDSVWSVEMKKANTREPEFFKTNCTYKEGYDFIMDQLNQLIQYIEK